jgi:hypothetical protein
MLGLDGHLWKIRGRWRSLMAVEPVGYTRPEIRRMEEVHPRDDTTAPRAGVFATRSADRPTSLGLHRVTVRPGRWGRAANWTDRGHRRHASSRPDVERLTHDSATGAMLCALLLVPLL